MRRYLTASVIARLVAALMLLEALARNPYGYYKLLRWVVCAAGAYSATVAFTEEKKPWVWVFGIVAVLFNPIIPVHLKREVWAIIDVVLAIFFGASIFFVREEPKRP